MKLLLPLLLLASLNIFPQVGIGTTLPNSQSILDIVSTEKGILIPRMTSVEKDAILPITIAEKGMLIYQTDNKEGFWYFNGVNWARLDTTDDAWENDSVNGFVKLASKSDGFTARDPYTGAVFTDDGKLGVGNSVPSYSIDVRGPSVSVMNSKYTVSNDGPSYIVFLDREGASNNVGDGLGYFTYKFRDASTTIKDGVFIKAHVENMTGSNESVGLRFSTYNGGASNYDVFNINGNGNVGIGKVNPDNSKLYVEGTGAASKIYLSKKNNTDTWGPSYVAFFDRTGGENVLGDALGFYAYKFRDKDGVVTSSVSTTAYVEEMNLGTEKVGWSVTTYDKANGGERYDVIRARGNGNVGIGVANPGEKLDINGAMHLEPGSAPTTANEGDIYMDSTTHKLRCYDGTTWNNLW